MRKLFLYAYAKSVGDNNLCCELNTQVGGVASGARYCVPAASDYLSMMRQGTYRWAAPGDVNAFFGLMLDNVVNLALLGGILVLAFGFPAPLVYTRMFPGTAVGVMFGDLVYTWLAFRLAKKTGRDDVTAMPLGLDSPSTIGMAFAVLGPAYLAAKSRMDANSAAILAWQVGMAAMVLIGVFKLAMSFMGEYVRRWVPEAGLLGSIGGVAIALLGALQLGEIYSEPVAGMVALGIILYALVAKQRLPFRVPVVLASVLVGSAIYYIMGAAGISLHHVVAPSATLSVGFPMPTLGFLTGFPIVLREYVPLALPFAILTVIGGIDVTESARKAGDDYSTRDILLTEAVATLLAGVCGGVSQSTPYIGHPAYKAMGGRAAYTLATGIFVGLGGMLGYIAFLADALPRPVLAPILVFIALEITQQAYQATPPRHAAAVTLAVLPSVAQLVVIFLSQTYNGGLMMAALDPVGTMKATGLTNPGFVQLCGVMILLANGFILTAMLWGGGVAFLIDRRMKAAATTFVVCALLAMFGIIHSVLPTAGAYLPWSVASTVPYHWAGAYLLVGLLLFLAPERESEHLVAGA
jgi:AGZA family xanthine/uracil permease-like MFS transporter